jgi:hypothetical protein
LGKREQHIRELEEKLVGLKEAIFKREVENRELKKRVSTIEESTTEESEEISRLKA